MRAVEATANELADLVLAGVKRATARAWAESQDWPCLLPANGSMSFTEPTREEESPRLVEVLLQELLDLGQHAHPVLLATQRVIGKRQLDVAGVSMTGLA